MLHVRISALIVTVVALVISATGFVARASLPKFNLEVDGYGPVKIGMSPTLASEKLGIKLSSGREPEEDDIYCHYLYPDGDFTDIGFMVISGEIVRIDVYSQTISVDGKIFVGSDESNVDDLFLGEIKKEIHPYLGNRGKYLTVAKGSGLAFVFETKEGKITRFRSGREKPVQYIEGCL